MNTRQLRYFLAVVDEGSFSAAARRLNIAQPALGGHVAALEQELGVKLLERSNKGVRVTSAGRRLRDHAENILRQIDIAAQDVSGGGSENLRGEVLVALPFTAARLIAGPLIRQVRARLPDVELRLIEGFTDRSTREMASGRVDLGVLPHADEISELSVRTLFFESLYLVGLWDGRGPREADIRFSDLSRPPLGWARAAGICAG